jgi:outer membrane protein assembly factor BamB
MTRIDPRAIAVPLAILSIGLLGGADWTRFRGPDAGGISADKGLPVQWSATENIAWKTQLPGPGASSPVTLGDKVFVTCYSGYGLDESEPGELDHLLHHVLCLDRAQGKILWDQTVKMRAPETKYKGFMLRHGYASSTPATDGKSLYVFFGHTGVFAYDLAGSQLWRADVGHRIHDWGSAASPILYKNLLIVNASVESEALVALDTASGKEVWHAGGIKASWATPLLVDLPDGRQELVIAVKDKVLGFEPASGEKLWECDGVKDYICPSAIAHGDMVYITAGRKPESLAVRAGGRGDVSQSHVLWRIKKTSKVGTPLYYDGLLHWVDNNGKAVCLEAANGNVLYEEGLGFQGHGDKVYASLVGGDGKLYAVSREGGAAVLESGKEFKELSHNDLGDKGIFNATPVISNGQLLLRSDQYLYCIGK